MPTIEFRRLAVDDLQQVFLWLIRPHVARGYASPPGSFMECVAKYGPRTHDGNVVSAYMVRVDGSDAGYIQAYDLAAFPDFAAHVGCERPAAGIDLFIGEEALVDRGLGPRIIDAFTREVVFARDGIETCVASPHEGNRASIRAFEKAGFRRWKVMRPGEGEQSECVMRRDRDDAAVRILPIDLERHAQTCIDFRRDSYLASFGTHEGCDAEMGADGLFYLEKLRKRMAQVPEGNAHVWHGDRIIGQTEMRLEEQPGVGYVNLFYLLPEWRGRGLGWRLHRHAVDVFTRLGMKSMRLSVSRSNEPAIAFYRRLGWRRVGFRPNKETMDILEFRL
jgi:RimJ/RimL family protein N-acetyltransferase